MDSLSEQADTLERRASVLAYHVNQRRVTHTPKKVVAAVIRCVLSLSGLVKETQSDTNFGKMFKAALENSVDEKDGPGTCDIILYDDSTIYIEGGFDIEKLRKFLITVPQPVEMSGIKNG